MKSVAPVFGWAAWITTLAAVLFVWTPSSWPQWAPFVAAAGGAWLIGLVLLLRRRRTPDLRLLPDVSLATVLLALGIASLVNSPSFGLWLTLVGAELVLVALVWLGYEVLTTRRRRES
jgi:asparagine N-glycosylation enzyme membrane subunit Stt3